MARWSYAFARRINTRLAGELAWRIFLSPPRSPYLDAQRAVLKQADRRALDVMGHKACAYSWGSGPAVMRVKTQIWIAISVYVLVAIVRKRLATEASLYTILQILSLMLFKKTPLDQLLNDRALQNPDQPDAIQLNLFD